ncbi:MAG: hypothetical protein IJH68_08695 [Thermoguttaceae bacterium]|nr:hypothetical protein [Thermoguttaceae bacterium]
MKTMKYNHVSLTSVLALLLCLYTFHLSAEDQVSPASIAGQMAKHGVTESVGCVTPTICALMGLPTTDVCEVEPLAKVLEIAQAKLDGKPVQKALIFCPDAIGKVQFEHWPDDFAPLVKEVDYLMTGTNVLPSVTPVCFSTIFTGASPAVHGIQKYEKPALTVETLFDVCAKAGLKAAIVAENDSSIDKVFRKRPIWYFSTPGPADAFEMCKFILNNYDNFDLIVCYDGSYDSVMHGTGVWDERAHQAARDSIHRYLELIRLTDEVWKGYNRVVVFAPDHGSHDSQEGKGGHGSDSPEDSIVNHGWRLGAAQN